MNMLRHVLAVMGMTSTVVRHEDFAPGALDGHDLVIVGPGPGDPRDGDHPKIAAFRAAVDGLLAAGQPFLAVCLGHQVLCGRLGIELAYKDIVFQGTQSRVDLDPTAGGPRRTSASTTPSSAGSTVRCPTASRSRPTRTPATSTWSAARTTAASSSTPSRSSPSTATTCPRPGARAPRHEHPQGRCVVRPPRLLHLEPRAPRRRRDRRAARGRRARRGHRRRGAGRRRGPTWCSRPARAPRTTSGDFAVGRACSSRPRCRCSACAWACRAWSRRTAAGSARSRPRTARWRRSRTTGPVPSRGLPSPFDAVRYHSLAALEVPAVLG